MKKYRVSYVDEKGKVDHFWIFAATESEAKEKVEEVTGGVVESVVFVRDATPMELKLMEVSSIKYAIEHNNT